MFGTNVLGFSGSRMFWKIVRRRFGKSEGQLACSPFRTGSGYFCSLCHSTWLFWSVEGILLQRCWSLSSEKSVNCCPLQMLTHSSILFLSKPKALGFRPQGSKSHKEARLCSIARPMPRHRPKVMGDLDHCVLLLEIFPVGSQGLLFLMMPNTVTVPWEKRQRRHQRCSEDELRAEGSARGKTQLGCRQDKLPFFFKKPHYAETPLPSLVVLDPDGWILTKANKAEEND